MSEQCREVLAVQHVPWSKCWELSMSAPKQSDHRRRGLPRPDEPVGTRGKATLMSPTGNERGPCFSRDTDLRRLVSGRAGVSTPGSNPTNRQ